MGPKVVRLVVAIATFTLPIVAYAAPARASGPIDLLTLVNTLRGVVNVAPLASDAALTSVAQQWANHMAGTGTLADNPNLATQAPSGWTKIGENIGDGYSLTAIYNALAGTSTARANMVDPTFNRTGIGVATDSHGQTWMAEDFGAFPPAPVPTLLFPTAGTVIFPSPQTFSWSSTPGTLFYCLTVGTIQGGIDLVNSGLLPNSQLSYAVPALPGGQPLWARIYAFALGTWTWTDVKFSVAGLGTAMFTRPTAGTIGVDTTKPFTWSPAPLAAHYLLTIGTTIGGIDVFSTGFLPPSQTSYAVPALPTGKTLWARIYSYISGSWNHYNDVSFTAGPR